MDNIRNRLIEADNFLAPVGQVSGDLATIKPIFRGKFVLENKLKPGRYYLLQVEFAINEEGDVVRLSAKWSRFEAGQTLPTQYLDVNLIDLLE